MRTVRGIPECKLPDGRRFKATITYTCDDEDQPYVETTFVDVAPGRIDVLLRPNAPFTTIFSIRVTAECRQMFPRIQAWFSTIRGRPFAVPPKDLAIHETCINVRVRGYFDAKFQIQFDESEIAEAMNRLTSLAETACMTTDDPRSTDATNHRIHGSGGGQRILKST
ncbi:MAG: hypothetical protein KatS3mg109_2025 [Pirellulaceae bacterium]|nr:MAG: hypothetical protein KatS3mg109_2025 [Pirellulaceae bacterium]